MRCRTLLILMLAACGNQPVEDSTPEQEMPIPDQEGPKLLSALNCTVTGDDGAGGYEVGYSVAMFEHDARQVTCFKVKGNVQDITCSPNHPMSVTFIVGTVDNLEDVINTTFEHQIREFTETSPECALTHFN